MNITKEEKEFIKQLTYLEGKSKCITGPPFEKIAEGESLVKKGIVNNGDVIDAGIPTFRKWYRLNDEGRKIGEDLFVPIRDVWDYE